MREKILVVDDHPDTASLIVLFLAREFDVRGATSLEEALPSLSWADLVLLDLGLGDVPPLEVARRVAKTRPRRVVLHSAYPPGVTGKAADLLHPEEVVMKPTGLAALLGTLRRALGCQR